ncbi:MAG: metal-dependent transcriptional regulator [Euryarchaeota archaeon]|nr:metal-dependent transcriptional regulator [Euryarchaeota archaeon]
MRLSRRAEDYLRIIYEVKREKGHVRVRDIARALDVKPPSVTEMVHRLSRRGLLIYEKRTCISLTEEGERLARSIKDRHSAIITLLEIMGVPEEVARRDAHRIEHVVSIETIECIKKFVKNAKT